ncbi:hypothetical protein B0H14DRAFT_222447 [Mycena olivaceomarginata]|nr:hypothetical protein B0H14DRAFT_222447 [Mycena olivaceomarginata]
MHLKLHELSSRHTSPSIAPLSTAVSLTSISSSTFPRSSSLIAAVMPRSPHRGIGSSARQPSEQGTARAETAPAPIPPTRRPTAWTAAPARVLTEQTCRRDARSCSETSGMEVAGRAHLLVLGRDICAGIISARAARAYERLRAPGTGRGMMLSCPPRLDSIRLCSILSNSSTPSSSRRLDSTRSTCSLSFATPHPCCKTLQERLDSSRNPLGNASRSVQQRGSWGRREEGGGMGRR